MTITKEEIYDLLESDVWKEIEAELKEEQTEAKELLCQLDFSISTTTLEAVKYQAKIEVIDQLFEKVESLKEDSE